MISAVDFYRASRWLSEKGVPVLPRAIDYLSRLIFACWLPHTASIGREVVLGYGGLGIVIHSDACIGDGVHIDQGVTIGGNGTVFGVPRIGSNVYIGAGAKILGPINVGDGSVIGANAVVVRDVPARSVVVGVPAKVVRENIDIDQYLWSARSAITKSKTNSQ